MTGQKEDRKEKRKQGVSSAQSRMRFQTATVYFQKRRRPPHRVPEARSDSSVRKSGTRASCVAAHNKAIDRWYRHSKAREVRNDWPKGRQKRRAQTRRKTQRQTRRAQDREKKERERERREGKALENELSEWVVWVEQAEAQR